MKSVSSFISKNLLAIVMCALLFLLVGCSTAQLGETAAEGNRRHIRNLRIDQSEMMADIDHFLLLENPSGLSDKRIP
jgi:hypothetical protein